MARSNRLIADGEACHGRVSQPIIRFVRKCQTRARAEKPTENPSASLSFLILLSRSLNRLREGDLTHYGGSENATGPPDGFPRESDEEQGPWGPADHAPVGPLPPIRNPVRSDGRTHPSQHGRLLRRSPPPLLAAMAAGLRQAVHRRRGLHYDPRLPRLPTGTDRGIPYRKSRRDRGASQSGGRSRRRKRPGACHPSPAVRRSPASLAGLACRLARKTTVGRTRLASTGSIARLRNRIVDHPGGRPLRQSRFQMHPRSPRE